MEAWRLRYPTLLSCVISLDRSVTLVTVLVSANISNLFTLYGRWDIKFSCGVNCETLSENDLSLCSQWRQRSTPLRMRFTKCSVRRKMKRETRWGKLVLIIWALVVCARADQCLCFRVWTLDRWLLSAISLRLRFMESYGCWSRSLPQNACGLEPNWSRYESHCSI